MSQERIKSYRSTLVELYYEKIINLFNSKIFIANMWYLSVLVPTYQRDGIGFCQCYRRSVTPLYQNSPRGEKYGMVMERIMREKIWVEAHLLKADSLRRDGISGPRPGTNSPPHLLITPSPCLHYYSSFFLV